MKLKLRYYLRGLAVGILLTTLILTIANADNKPLTDAQIRQKAREMGMVDGDSLKLSSLQGETEAVAASAAAQESGATASSESASTQESSAAASSESTAAQESGAAASTESTAAQESGAAASTESASTQESSASAQESSAPAGNTGEAVILRIVSGATSYTVSKDLAAAGLVEDAKAYDTYLCDNGFASKIHVGTYEIYPGTSGEEIARMIAY